MPLSHPDAQMRSQFPAVWKLGALPGRRQGVCAGLVKCSFMLFVPYSFSWQCSPGRISYGGKIILALMLLCFSFFCFGQTTKDTAPSVPSPVYRSLKKDSKKIFRKKRESPKTLEEEVADFRKRMIKVGRRKKREMKKLEHPKYSDPLYFGHRRPPKKRPAHKRKFCKECGIIH